MEKRFQSLINWRSYRKVHLQIISVSNLSLTGKWENTPRQDCYTPEVKEKIEENPWEFKAPGGESQRDVEERMVEYIETKIRELADKYKDKSSLSVAVFGHGLAFKCLLRNILNSASGKTWTIQLDNTSVSEFE